MLTATQSEQVERYLAELSAALSGLPEAERADVVAGVREHIQASLTDRPDVTHGDIEQVLQALGDPLTIAAAATGDDSDRDGSAAGTAGGEPRREVPVLQRDWVPGAVLAALLAGPLVLTFFVSFGGILLLPFLLVAGWALLWISSLWMPWQKLAGTFVLPALGILLMFGLFTSGSTETCSGGSDIPTTCTTEGGLTPTIFWIILAVVAVASIATAVVLYRTGRRRAAEIAQIFSTGA